MTDRTEGGSNEPRPDDDNQPQPERRLPPARHRVRLVAVSSPPKEEPPPAPDPEPTAETPPDSASKASSNYEVGYKKPPKHTQFKKGQIANPKGRPKGAKSLPTLVDEELSAQVKVRIGSRSSRGSNAPTRRITGVCM